MVNSILIFSQNANNECCCDAQYIKILCQQTPLNEDHMVAVAMRNYYEYIQSNGAGGTQRSQELFEVIFGENLCFMLRKVCTNYSRKLKVRICVFFGLNLRGMFTPGL